MKNIPTSKVTQTSEILRESIAQGEWSEFLPSERTLSASLMISRACLRQALELLTQDGILAPAERSKRRAIMRRPRKAKAISDRKAVFFTPEPAHKATPLVLEQVAQLRHHLAKAKITVDLVSSPVFKHPNASDDTIAKVIREHPEAHWILHQCPEHIQRWFTNQSIRSIVFGSLFQGVDLPAIDIDFRSASRHATGHLLSKGHQRLALIRFRSHLAGDDLAVDGMLEALHAHSGISLPKPVIMNHNFHVERLTNALDRLFSSSQVPTGLITVNHHHFVTTFSHLLSLGIRIPKDLSIISLSHDPVLDRLSPKPVCYSAGDHLIRHLARMIVSPSTSKTAKSPLLIPEMTQGSTIVAPSHS